MAKYKAVGFDYGGVVGGSGSRPDFTKRICGLLGISEEEHKKTYFSLNRLINTGQLATWAEFWKLYLEKIDKTNFYDSMMVLDEENARQLSIVDKQMLELVDTIKAKGYKTGLLSNNTKENGDRFRKLGIDRHFDAFVISAEVHMMKPDPEIYVLFAEKMRVKPNELIFIDDSENSLSSATTVGFTPILYRDIAQLQATLNTLLDT